jgi:hypothetical protein
MNTDKRLGKIRIILDKANAVRISFLSIRRLLNNKMDGRYSPHRVALVATLGVVVIWFLMLMVTPAQGLADDGSLGNTLSKAGLSYLQTNPEDIYNNYFVRVYALDSNYFSTTHEITNTQDVLITLAIMLDETVHKNDYFDIRFLALIYGLLYFPAVYRLVKSVCMRLYYFSEALVIAALSVVIFGDISYLAYFNSFYPEALWSICFLYIAGAISILQFRKSSYLNLFIIVFFSMVLCLSREQCGFIGFILSAFFLNAIFFNRQALWKILCIIFTLLMSIVGMISINMINSDFTATSKYHAMTRGVLFQAPNPEKALTEFGINPSYSVLTNTSAYDYYPFVLPDSEHLQKGFLDQYDTGDIVIYYVKHPGSMFNMLDLAVKDTINLRRSFCGNFEQKTGMPKLSQSIMWSSWSFFKQRSMPKTVGFLILLLLLSFLLYGRTSMSRKLSERDRNARIMMNAILLIAGIGLSQAVICIIMSGDAELGRHAFLMGAAMDMMIFLLFTEALPKMKIIEDKEVV